MIISFSHTHNHRCSSTPLNFSLSNGFDRVHQEEKVKILPWLIPAHTHTQTNTSGSTHAGWLGWRWSVVVLCTHPHPAASLTILAF